MNKRNNAVKDGSFDVIIEGIILNRAKRMAARLPKSSKAGRAITNNGGGAC